jgi:NAD(P)-dependent dehydrogenase (short-subunit alcohol dehydrogenase family)
MDVTKHGEISRVAQTVATWMSPVNSGSKRILHAIVNNAGKGEAKPFDWYENTERISSDVDVNFYGSVYVIQQFLPMLKNQYQIYKQWSNENGTQRINPRIINVISMAGLVNGTYGASMYHASKHAMEGFAASLRVELFPFGLGVININPSFHKTNMVLDLTARLGKSWETIPTSRRGHYSKGNFCSRRCDIGTIILSFIQNKSFA